MRPRVFSRHAHKQIPRLRAIREAVAQIQTSEAETRKGQPGNRGEVHVESRRACFIQPFCELKQNVIDRRAGFRIFENVMSVLQNSRLFHAVSSAYARSRCGMFARLPGHGIEGPG